MIRHSLMTVEEVIDRVNKTVNTADDVENLMFHWDFEADSDSKIGDATDGTTKEFLKTLKKLNKSMVLRVNEIYSFHKEPAPKAEIIESTATRTGTYADAVGGTFTYTVNVFRCSRCKNEISMTARKCPHCYAELHYSTGLSAKVKKEKAIKKAYDEAKDILKEALSKLPKLTDSYHDPIREDLQELIEKCDRRAEIDTKALYSF